MAEQQLYRRISMLEDKYTMIVETETGNDRRIPAFSLGKVYIFNNQTFDDYLGLKYRNGSDEDVKELSKTFEELGFPEPQIHQDLNYDPFRQEITKIAKDANKELEKCRSLVCVFLSHGEDGNIFMKDGRVAVDYIYEELSNSESLQDKPKIFIFQACRGSKLNDPETWNRKRCKTEGAAVASSDEMYQDETDATVMLPFDSDGLSGGTPRGADCLTVYPTTKGYVSFRNTHDGSWFIQKLCEVLRDYAAGKYDKYRPDIMELLTLVSAEISGESRMYMGKPLKQMPSFVSTLRKRLFLRDKDNVAV